MSKQCPERIYVRGLWFKRMLGGTCDDCACFTTQKPADREFNAALCNALPLTCMPGHNPEHDLGYFVEEAPDKPQGRSADEQSYPRKLRCVGCEKEFDVCEGVSLRPGGFYICEDCIGKCLPNACESMPLDECSACCNNPYQEFGGGE